MALQIQAPGKAGSFIPTAIDLAGASWGQYLAKRLVRFRSLGEGPDREDISGREVGQPITEPSYWEGRWVLCPLRLERENGEGQTFADAVASVSRERRIVSTPLTGRAGTVKEYVGEGDWAVSMVIGLQRNSGGVITDEWPGDELRALRRLLEAKEPLRVHSEFLDAMDIGRVVVRSCRVRQMTESNYQVVEIDAVSDEDYEIFSKDYERPREEAER